MSIDTTSPRTRRAILLGALGGAVASVAAAVGRASPVSADDGEAMLIGHTYSSTSPTKINATGVTAIWATSDSLAGVYGTSTSNIGVAGDCYSADAVVGSSQGGVGVRGSSATEKGVFGITSALDQPAILGWSANDFAGVQGYSGLGDAPPAPPAHTGVYGSADHDEHSVGVRGQSPSGTGVVGKSNSGEGIRGTSSGSNGTAGSSASGIASGVYGENTGGGFGTYGRSNVGSAGSGVFGESTAGTGVSAATTTGVALRATSTGTGLAITAQGRVAFSTAGLAAVAVGSATKTIKPGSDIVAGSLVLCTLESGQPHLAIQRVTKNTSANTFTVYLSAAVSAGNTAKVGWFVIG